MLDITANTPEFDPAYESQASFRALMDCMARPGSIRTLKGVEAPTPFAPATAALIKSLADYETPLWLDAAFAAEKKVADWIRFHTGAPITREPGEAAFALIADACALPDFARFAQGTPEYPDRSTTVIVQIDGFTGDAITLKGPGVKTTREFAASPLPADFAARMKENRALFPRGVDLVLVAGNDIAALPRSVTVEER
ncbi:phosphonate C-P lyase system protein PhnH [Pseudolabrys sp. FHR47]|uniref:phosphonate C-P lyase system protein PhnH n=1 Tax=Pseudolabrys sp. FHR47 TaxID=2562284 RepID=UPI0010BF2F59|nr:phosphonate C-P lyase system protein PhnH [Pseudolabrys sp. FHR47]